MQNNKPAPTPTTTGLKLSKENRNNKVNPTLYKSMVRNLMYLTTTRLNLMYVVSLISRFMEKPKDTQWKARKKILKHVN